ncbi:AraC family transcriptional regulator [Lederbergia citrea]|uniref:AraC family transcriptional regulator n=1 Tax=Lederbergia citrea TaxID=2833581 RepID=UPI001BCA5FC9|nr:AraC family transcriptional regulator [Lederbergia citrea]MBS4203367.1 helix-turn-helix domain-containing protein [Lederbergia citrea]
MKLHSSQFMNEKTFPFWINRVVHDEHNLPPMHCHDFIELIYVVDGEAQHVFENEAYSISTNHIFIINPGEFHTFHIEPGKKIELINCLFLPSILHDTWLKELGVSQSMDFYYIHPFLDMSDRFHHSLNLQGDYSFHVQSLLEYMIKEFESALIGFSSLIKLKLAELLIVLSRIYNEKETLMKNISSQYDERKLLVRRICGYLERHYDQKISTQTLCELFNISTRHLNRLFKQDTGLTVIEMIHKIRIEKAKQLLIKSNEKVIDVAIKVGYDDPAFFSRLFKRKIGCSPGRYKIEIL